MPSPFVYGQPIIYGTASYPRLFTGITESFSYAEAMRRTDVVGENYELAATVLDQRKFNLQFTATITNTSTDFLDLSVGAKIDVQGITGGVILASQAVETWSMGKEKTASITATHFPDMTDTAGQSAGTLSGYTPGGSNGAGVQMFPAGLLRWSTVGLSTAFGVISDLTLTQTLEFMEDPNEEGQITTVFAGKYSRTIDLTVAATGERPAVGTILNITGAPAHASGYRIMSSELSGQKEAKKLYRVNALWIPPFAA